MWQIKTFSHHHWDILEEKQTNKNPRTCWVLWVFSISDPACFCPPQLKGGVGGTTSTTSTTTTGGGGRPGTASSLLSCQTHLKRRLKDNRSCNHSTLTLDCSALQTLHAVTAALRHRSTDIRHFLAPTEPPRLPGSPHHVCASNPFILAIYIYFFSMSVLFMCSYYLVCFPTPTCLRTTDGD